jgi:hypothetical protein
MRINNLIGAATLHFIFFTGLSLGLPSHAQSPQEITAKEARDHLKWAHGELVRAHELLPSTYGGNPQKELQQIQQAERIVQTVIGSLKGAHKADASGFATTQTNIARLKAQLRIGRLAQQVSATQLRIRQIHENGKPAGTVLLRGYEDQVAGLANHSDESWRQTVEAFQETGVEYRRTDSQLAAAIADEKKQELVAEAKRELDGSVAIAFETIEAIQTHLRTTERPIPEDMIDELWQAAKHVQNQDDKAARYFFHAEYNFRIFNAWRDPSDEAGFRKVASTLRGAHIDSGVLKRSKLKVNFVSRPSWCYTLYLHPAEDFSDFSSAYAKGSGDGIFRSLSVTSKNKSNLIQHFDLAHHPRTELFATGFCTSDKSKIKIRGTSQKSLAGQVRFMLLGWDRKSFPEWETTYLEIDAPHDCAVSSWKESWTNPVPGTIAYLDNEPHLLLSGTWPKNANARVLAIDGTVKTVPKNMISRTPPGSAEFAKSFTRKSCPLHLAEKNSAYTNYQKCAKKALGAVNRSCRKAVAKLKKARSAATVTLAEEKVEEMRVQYADRISASCGKLEERLDGSLRQSFGEIIDHHGNQTYGTSINRVPILQDEITIDFPR